MLFIYFDFLLSFFFIYDIEGGNETGTKSDEGLYQLSFISANRLLFKLHIIEYYKIFI